MKLKTFKSLRLCAYSFFEHSCPCTSVTGDDWEHEEIFTDDDEGVANDPEEREDLAPEVPAPPEIKQVSFWSTHSYILVSCAKSVIFSLCHGQFYS
jgi:hypothetical protein